MAEARPWSLSRRVLALAVGAIVVVWIAAATRAYLGVRHEADELLDGYLAQAAAILHASAGRDVDDRELEHVPELHKYARRLAFQVFDGERLTVHSANAPDAPMSAKREGFDDVEFGGRRWRVFASRGVDRRVLVQVAEERHQRDEIVAAVAGTLATPLLVSLPLLAALLWLAVRSGLRPLRVLGREVAARDPANLDAIAVARPPAEIAPLVSALNGLLSRVRASLEHERRFTADAAHELRTPIAGIRAQAEVARDAGDDAVRVRALDGVVAGCDRAARLVDQLLTLARLEPRDAVAPDIRADLAAVARDAVAQAAPAAIEKDVDVALDAGPATVRGDPALLAILLRNVLDNAIRYSARGGHVVATVAPSGRGIDLVVEDDGPGVVDELLPRLGDRFFRGLGTGADGSGLGLSIVARIAALHGATLRFARGRRGHGLRVSISFPPVP